jgi:hypothetical protein
MMVRRGDLHRLLLGGGIGIRGKIGGRRIAAAYA